VSNTFFLIRSIPQGFTIYTLKYRKEGKMQAGAHDRDILDGLLARDKTDNGAQRPVKWSAERVIIGKRSYQYSGTVQNESHSSACHTANLFLLG
jgi:hypothetical protein